MSVKLQISDRKNATYFDRKWKLGSCKGPKPLDSFTSISTTDEMTYIDKCCLTPGNYTLICKNDVGPFGWGNSFLEILGNHYCDDFVGYKGLRRIVIKGNVFRNFFICQIFAFYIFLFKYF